MASGNLLNSLQGLTSMVNTREGRHYRNASELPTGLHKYARFAQGAYDQSKTELRGYKIDPKLSTKQFKVYKKGSKVVFAVRGSEEILNDFVINDLNIARGKVHKQLPEAERKLAEIKQKYPKARITLTGHSLGGATAAMLGSDASRSDYRQTTVKLLT